MLVTSNNFWSVWCVLIHAPHFLSYIAHTDRTGHNPQQTKETPNRVFTNAQ